MLCVQNENILLLRNSSWKHDWLWLHFVIWWYDSVWKLDGIYSGESRHSEGLLVGPHPTGQNEPVPSSLESAASAATAVWPKFPDRDWEPNLSSWILVDSKSARKKTAWCLFLFHLDTVIYLASDFYTQSRLCPFLKLRQKFIFRLKRASLTGNTLSGPLFYSI